jgi:hypothetical protein
MIDHKKYYIRSIQMLTLKLFLMNINNKNIISNSKIYLLSSFKLVINEKVIEITNSNNNKNNCICI